MDDATFRRVQLVGIFGTLVGALIAAARFAMENTAPIPQVWRSGLGIRDL